MDDAGIIEFADEARRFCAFVEQASELPLDVRLVVARERLAALYVAALTLPEGAPAEADTPEVAERPAVDVGRFHLYRLVFDPYDWLDTPGAITHPPEPVLGDLGDDLTEIDRDLRRGLAVIDRDGPAAACWEWRFAFETHWGDHALGALRALHAAISRA
ncbi:MAG TPA: DUF5063 domain-containing protein [Kofleriaceae bacterium]|nr:DUF5063 domain-containing protein [Kofleriaceae bacterium]